MTSKLRELKAGDRFICGHGDVWLRGREHGSHHDVFLAVRERDGHESCFGGNIEFKVPGCTSPGGPLDCYDIDCPECA